MLHTVDLTKSLTKEEYVRQLPRQQLLLRSLAYQLYERRRTMIIVYEGWDAAGKGGNIKRVTEKLDPRGYEVMPIMAPHGEERTHHYLWRFWRRLRPPDEKQVLIFDRSWYGRVLVERLEGFCTEEEWKRAYREINEFERQLVDFGTILVKFWIHISKDEQLRRFEERRETHYKAWKLSAEDWRNRAKWDLYEGAANDMLLKTSTITAPWTVLEGNDKWHARVKAVRTIVDTLSSDLDYVPPEPTAKRKKKKAKKKAAARAKAEAKAKAAAKAAAGAEAEAEAEAQPASKAAAAEQSGETVEAGYSGPPDADGESQPPEDSGKVESAERPD